MLSSRAYARWHTLAVTWVLRAGCYVPNFRELRHSEVRSQACSTASSRTISPGAAVAPVPYRGPRLLNIWDSLEPPVEYMGPLRGRQTLARKGASAHERASSKGSEQKHPRVGARALLQQRDVGGGPRLPRRGGHLLRAQGQGQRHSALHLRADRRSEDSRGRRGSNRLAAVARVQRPRNSDKA